MEATEKQFVFVTMTDARQMLKLKNRLSEVCVILPENRSGHHNDRSFAARLKAALPADDYEVHTWQELLPMLNAYLKLFDSFIYIWYVVVFIAMSFGIINTTLMAVFERMREFGLLKALGMKPWRIIKEVLTESFFLLILGIFIGNSLGFVSVFVLSKTGVDLSLFAAGAEMWGISRVIFPAVRVKDVIIANLVVFILGLLVSFYPAAKAARFTPVEALAYT